MLSMEQINRHEILQIFVTNWTIFGTRKAANFTIFGVLKGILGTISYYIMPWLSHVYIKELG